MMVDNYEDSADAAISVEESVNEKYRGIYYTARGILTGRSLRHFAFLAGSGGIGKCVIGDTKLNIKVDDIIYEEIEKWLSHRQ